MRIGIAADHGGFELKVQLTAALKAAGYEVADFGAHELVSGDDYPDFVVPLAKAVARGEAERGLAICGSGVGACVTANKVPGVRAALITDPFSAHQGVEDDDMNPLPLRIYLIRHGETEWARTPHVSFPNLKGDKSQLKHDSSTNTLIRCYVKSKARRHG